MIRGCRTALTAPSFTITVWTWVAIACLGVTPSRSSAQQPQPIVSVLAVMPQRQRTFPTALDETLKARLRKERIAITSSFAEHLKADDLEQVNVVVLTYLGICGKGVDPLASGVRELLLQFVREGGGLLIIPGGVGGYYVPSYAEVTNRLLQPLDAKVLVEPITDRKNELVHRFFVKYRFFKTTNITPHVVTRGVHSLVFPCGRHEKHLETFALKVGPKWSVLVRGATTAQSHRLKDGNFWKWEPGTYPSEPPIVAVRTFQNGRVALMGTTARYYIQVPFHRAFNGFVYAQGDGWRFFVQMLRWLAEPSVNAGRVLSSLPPPDTQAKAEMKRWPLKSEWLRHVLETLPAGFGPKYYADCGDADDVPFSQERCAGWTEGSEPYYGWHWGRPLAYHATAGTVRWGRKVSYVFSGLTRGKRYKLGLVGWSWDGRAVRVKLTVNGTTAPGWEWSWPSFTKNQVPQSVRWLDLPRSLTNTGKVEVTLLPGKGERSVSIGEIWLLESGLPRVMPSVPSVADYETVPLQGLEKVWSGVIGVHSAFSDGKGSVAEWVAEAQRLGFHFLVFTENYEQMNPDKYRRLVEECRRASTQTFLAVPGLELSAPYGKRGVVHGVCVNPKSFPERKPNMVFNLKFHERSPLMVNLFKPGVLNPWEFRFWEGVQAWRYDERGEHDGWKTYTALASAGYNVHPYVVHCLRSPEALKTLDGMRVYFLARWLRAIVPGGFRFRFLSDGPVIEQFAVKRHRGGGEYAGEWVRVSLRVRSDAPLRRVSIVDRGSVLRRFYPRSKQFSKTVVFPADQWRVLWLEVEDEVGHRALSDHINVQMMHFGIPQCADNQNNMFMFYSPRGVGHVLLGAWHVGEDAGSITNSLWLAKEINPPGQESGELAALRCQTGRNLIRLFTRSKQWLPLPSPRLRNLFWSEDAVVFDYTAESDVGTWRATFTGFRPRLHGFNWLLTDTRLTLKKSVALGENARGPEILFKQIRGNKPVGPWRKVSYWHGRNAQCSTADVPDEGTLHLPFPTGSGVGCWPNRAGNFAVLAVDGQVDAWVYGPDIAPRIVVGQNSPNTILKPGTTLHTTLITVIDSGESNDDSQLSQFRTFLGLSGKPGFQVRVTHGVLRTASPIVLVDAKDGYVTFEFNCNDILTPVGVIVRGVGENCTAILCDLDTGWWKHLGVYEGSAYAVVERAGTRRLFVGNPLQCDNPSVRVEWLRAPGQRGVPWASMEFRVHNPTPQKQRCRISLAPALGALFGAHQWEVAIPAGATRYFSSLVQEGRG